MKRLLSEAAWSQQTKRVQRRIRRRQHASLLAAQATLASKTRHTIRLNAPEELISAPSNFSLITNPEEVIRFFDRVRATTQSRKNVRLDFRDIESLAPDAIAFMIARCRRSKARNYMHVHATKPTQPSLRKIWNDSGLTDVFRSSDGDEVLERRGRILTQSMIKADPNAALALRQFAAEHIKLDNESHWLSVQTVLIECMTNTFNHATGQSRYQRHMSDEPWYAAVYCDEDAGSAKFSFLDNGVGIIENLRQKPFYKRWFEGLGSPDARVLRNLLRRKIASATGLKHRGEGLPEIRTIVQVDHEIEKFVIVTNRVVADVSAGTYLMIDADFQGTFLYWEKPGEWRKKS